MIFHTLIQIILYFSVYFPHSTIISNFKYSILLLITIMLSIIWIYSSYKNSTNVFKNIYIRRAGLVAKPFHILCANMNSGIILLKDIFFIVFSREEEQTIVKNSYVFCTIHWTKWKLKFEATSWRKPWDYLPEISFRKILCFISNVMVMVSIVIWFIYDPLFFYQRIRPKGKEIYIHSLLL